MSLLVDQMVHQQNARRRRRRRSASVPLCAQDDANSAGCTITTRGRINKGCTVRIWIPALSRIFLFIIKTLTIYNITSRSLLCRLPQPHHNNAAAPSAAAPTTAATKSSARPVGAAAPGLDDEDAADAAAVVLELAAPFVPVAPPVCVLPLETGRSLVKGFICVAAVLLEKTAVGPELVGIDEEDATGIEEATGAELMLSTATLEKL